jgi:hypothetical protein
MNMTCLLSCALVALGAGLFVAPAHALIALPPIPAPRPVPPPGWSYVWIAPVYQTVTDRHWVPEAARWVQEWREISPGRFEQVWRQIITPGHWETTTRRILVSPGHWELVRMGPPPIIVEPPVVISPPAIMPGPRTVGVEGYSSGPGEDLSKFSPLTQWPK